MKEGLKYPLPERLKHKEKKGSGHIIVKGPQSYSVNYGKYDRYVCSCRTYEQAYYVKQEMHKVGWDKTQLQRILDDYPIWYTWLMNFWKYVNPGDPRGKARWNVIITPKRSKEGKLEKITFSKVEDALWERDLLIKYNYDEELLVECADDSQNPYYDMDLPPYPQRKVRHIRERADRTELFNGMKRLILEGVKTQDEISENLDTTSTTIRLILQREFDSSWKEFMEIVERGDDPNLVLEQKPIIYNPNLDYIRPNKNYVQANGRESGCKYSINYKGTFYGSYPTREMANKISNDLQKEGWDKSKLREIQLRNGHHPVKNSRRWVYENTYKSKKTGEVKIYNYCIRKKGKDKKMQTYGTYKRFDVAERIRDLLIENDWNKESLHMIQEQVKNEFGLEEL